MFDISFSINNTSNNISGFDLGHIRILSDGIIISSYGRSPDQSMMIFPTIVEMLDGLRKFLENKKVKEYRLVGTDSSFTILFKKKRSGVINIEVGELLISDLDEKLLAKQVYVSCNLFFNEAKNKMMKDDPIIDDVEMALCEYRNSL